MAKIVKVINRLKPDAGISRKIESNTSLTLKEGKPFSNQINDWLCGTLFQQTNITNKLIKRRTNKLSLGASTSILKFKTNLNFSHNANYQMC